MNEILAPLISTGQVLCYLDDILIATGPDISHHRSIVNEMLTLLAANDLYLKPEKCQFEKNKLAYLGVIISGGTIHMDPSKVEAVRSWPTPHNVHDICVFLGLVGWLCPFLKGFALAAKPLTKLTAKNTTFT